MFIKVFSGLNSLHASIIHNQLHKDVVEFVTKQDKTGSTFTNLLTFSYKTTILQAASSSVSFGGPQSQHSPTEGKKKKKQERVIIQRINKKVT